MNRHIAVALAVVAACTLPVLAQSGASGSNTDTLGALLVEVRALRVAMERAATTTPQIQLLAARLSVENERLERATRDADQARQELERVVSESAALNARVGLFEEMLTRETDPSRLRDIRQDQAAMKMQIDESAGRELRLRARESELANAVAAEQAQWLDLNRRVDQLEQDLAARRPR
jgi:chromosome segregation ATPase